MLSKQTQCHLWHTYFYRENLCPAFRQMEEGRQLFLHLLFSVAFSSKESLCPAGLFVLCYSLYSRGMSPEPRNAGGLWKLENAHSFPLSLLMACIQLFHFSLESPMSDF